MLPAVAAIDKGPIAKLACIRSATITIVTIRSNERKIRKFNLLSRMQIEMAFQVFAALVFIWTERTAELLHVRVADHVSFQIVSIAIAITANRALERLFQMRLFVFAQRVHVLETGRALIALHIFFRRVRVKM